MKKIWEWIKNNPNRAMFIVPIILVAIISISHVVSWYDIMNPYNWAIYLSIAIEIGAMTALVAATNKIKGGVWVMFGLVTFIQMIGNIFFSYKEIDATGDLFKSWMELTGPVWEALGSDVNDVIVHKRWLAFLGGGLLPIISLTSLHFFIKYEDPNKEIENVPKNEVEVINSDEVKKEIILDKPEVLNEEIIKVAFNKNNQNIENDIIFSESILEKDDEITTTTTEKNEIKIEMKDIGDNNPVEIKEQVNSKETPIKDVDDIFNDESTTKTIENKRVLTYTKDQ
jgi:hypothetical protein